MYLDLKGLRENLKYLSFNSALARSLLSLVYKPGKVYKVPFGPLRGMRLYYDRSVNFHVMLGLWELREFEVLSALIDRKVILPDIVCDVGANLGVYCLWFSRRVRHGGCVYAFEPSLTVLPLLKQNLRLNRARNVVVVKAAVCDRRGPVRFYLGPHHHTSTIEVSYARQPERWLVVEGVSLDEFFAGQGTDTLPDFIKIDVEGGAGSVLRGCSRTIERKRAYLLVESHNPDEDGAISEFLLAHDYQAYRVTNHRWVRKPRATFPERDGVWGTLLLCPSETAERVAACLPDGHR